MNRMIKIGLWCITTLLVTLTNSLESQAATTGDSLVYSLYFRQSDDLLLKDYRGNEQTLDEISKVMTRENIARIVKINIIGSSSPEGNMALNEQLAHRRANSVRGYFIWRWKFTNQQAIKIIPQTDYLSAWVRQVERDANVPRKAKVLEILNSEASVQTKWANIQLLVGDVSQYMEQHIFPQLRNAVSFEITFAQESTPISTPVEVAVTQPETPAQPQPTAEAPIQKVIENNPQEQQITKPNKPLFALKTNLLFDVASILNIEVEVPIGKRWSIAGELMFPWWLWDSKQHRLQVMSGTIEGRYWFGDRQKRDVMTGWFAGVHVGGGYYDLEWNRKGYQGEFYLAAGVGGGYAHTINKKGSLRMEYSLGVGYLSTNYRHYEAKFSDLDNSWHLYRQDNGKFSWFGPTRAKVSLVWMLDTNLFKKRGGRK